MAIYRGKGGKTDVVPADGDQEFAGSIIAEKDIHAHGNISADGDITVKGDLHYEGNVTGDGSGLENVPTPFLQADDCIYVNNQVITNDYTMPVGKNGMSAGDITVNGEVTIPDGSLWHVVGEDKEVSLEILGIPNHELVDVDEGGNVSATSFNGDGSGLTGLSIPDAYTKTETDVLLNDKADKATTYNKTEIDNQHNAQQTLIEKNGDDIAQNKTDIATNKNDITALSNEVGSLTGSIIYKGSLNATVTPAPTGGHIGDMWINEYNVAEPSTTYPVAAGWEPVTEVKYDDKLIKTDSGWDKIESVLGVPSYTAGEIDDLLDEKADKADVDAQLATKADVGDSYLKEETDELLGNKANVGDSYFKDEVDTELEKKADKTDTYTKDEVNELLENTSGAIIGNYTNKWSDSVARDPEAGNLYLVYGMNFSSKYDEVTKIYISDTDGDGEVRDFDEVQENDKIKLSSDNGSGEYTISTISDVGGYREFVVSTDASNGTIANESAVSIVMDVASSGGGDTIEEAPVDNHQYARQNKSWTKVVSINTGGGSGGGDVTPPVAFSVESSEEQTLVSSENTLVVCDNVKVDTNSAWNTDNNYYTVPQDGIMNLQASVLLVSDSYNFDYGYIRIYKNNEMVKQVHVNPSDPANKNLRSVLFPISCTVDVKQDDVLTLKVLQHGEGANRISSIGTSFSGHMVGSTGAGGDSVKVWEPHNYTYIKNIDPNEILPPSPGQVYLAGDFGPLADENYSSIRYMFISKYDQEGNELPFPERWYGNQNPEIKMSSSNGKGRFYAENVTSSDDWNPTGWEGETYYQIELSSPLDTSYTTITEGTVSEGETVQIETSEEGHGVDWYAKDIASPPDHTDNELHPAVTVPYAEVNYENIHLNGLWVGATPSESPYTSPSNIYIGEKPFADTTVNGEYIPGIYWNPYTVRGNIAMGSGMMPSVEDASDNIIIGNDAMGDMVSGDFNTVVGNYAGWGMEEGSNNIFIGNSAEPKTGLASYQTGEVNNQVVLGNQQMETLYLGKHKIFPFPGDLGDGTGGGVEEAPRDGGEYSRYMSTWTRNSSIPEPPNNNQHAWGRTATHQFEKNGWTPVRKHAEAWYNFNGAIHSWNDDAPEYFTITMNSLSYNFATELKISGSPIQGTELHGGTYLIEILRALNVGDYIDVRTTKGANGDGNNGGGLLKITEKTEHGNDWIKFGVDGSEIDSNDNGVLSVGDGIAVTVPGSVNHNGVPVAPPKTEEIYQDHIAIVDNPVRSPEEPTSVNLRTTINPKLNNNELAECTWTYQTDAGGNRFATMGTTTSDGFRIITNNKQAVRINESGGVYFGGIQPGEEIANFSQTGNVQFPRLGYHTTGVPNLYVDSNGNLRITSNTAYTTEEIDKKLAVKDELIEKLSARLDELEKRAK